MTEKTPYVPQAGHLVRDSDGQSGLVTWTEAGIVKIQWKDGCSWDHLLTHFQGQNPRITFLADRSAEWVRLFDINTPTP